MSIFLAVDAVFATLDDERTEAVHRLAVVLDHVRMDRATVGSWRCRCPWCVRAIREIAARIVPREEEAQAQRTIAKADARRLFVTVRGGKARASRRKPQGPAHGFVWRGRLRGWSERL